MQSFVCLFAYLFIYLFLCLLQRMDYSVLIPFLPRKHEYVIKVRLSILQRTLYHHFLSTFVYPEGTLGKKGRQYVDLLYFSNSMRVVICQFIGPSSTTWSVVVVVYFPA